MTGVQENVEIIEELTALEEELLCDGIGSADEFAETIQDMISYFEEGDEFFETSSKHSSKEELLYTIRSLIKELKYEEYHGDIIDVLQNAYNVIAEV